MPCTCHWRFWEKVRKTDGCWLWTANTNEFGHGKYWDGIRVENAHRHSWRIHNGPIPDGLSVLHRCDVPDCVNPQHLFLGTQSDNIHDMMKKGRRGYTGLRGEKNPHGKLDEAKVYEIRRRGDAGEPIYLLAKEFRVGWTAVDRIVRRLNWKHLPEADRSSTTVLTPGEY